jgi:IBR domain, a half RING-finger domain
MIGKVPPPPRRSSRLNPLHVQAPMQLSPDLSECSICCTTVPAQNLLKLGHVHTDDTCADCMREYLRTRIVDQRETVLHCLQENCEIVFLYNEVKEMAAAADFEMYLISREVSDGRWDEMLLRRHMERDPNYQKCCNPNCKGGLIVDNQCDLPPSHSTELIQADASYFTCPQCNDKTCLSCHQPFHSGRTCLHFQKGSAEIKVSERLSEAWLQVNAKYCKCGRWIQKLSGCDHIVCKCGRQWCYRCGADHVSIAAIGNTAHALDCPHYA